MGFGADSIDEREDVTGLPSQGLSRTGALTLPVWWRIGFQRAQLTRRSSVRRNSGDRSGRMPGRDRIRTGNERHEASRADRRFGVAGAYTRLKGRGMEINYYAWQRTGRFSLTTASKRRFYLER
jgi:hypothetical protein